MLMLTSSTRIITSNEAYEIMHNIVYKVLADIAEELPGIEMDKLRLHVATYHPNNKKLMGGVLDPYENYVDGEDSIYANLIKADESSVHVFLFIHRIYELSVGIETVYVRSIIEVLSHAMHTAWQLQQIKGPKGKTSEWNARKFQKNYMKKYPRYVSPFKVSMAMFRKGIEEGRAKVGN